MARMQVALAWIGYAMGATWQHVANGVRGPRVKPREGTAVEDGGIMSWLRPRIASDINARYQPSRRTAAVATAPAQLTRCGSPPP